VTAHTFSFKIRSLTAIHPWRVMQKSWVMRSWLGPQFEAEALAESAKEFSVPSSHSRNGREK
jgi:hypothetical protein